MFSSNTPLRWFLFLVLAASSIYAAYVQGEWMAQSRLPAPTEKPPVYYVVEVGPDGKVEAQKIRERAR